MPAACPPGPWVPCTLGKGQESRWLCGWGCPIEGHSARGTSAAWGPGPLTIGVGVRSLLVGHDSGRGVIDLPGEREAQGEWRVSLLGGQWPPQSSRAPQWQLAAGREAGDSPAASLAPARSLAPLAAMLPCSQPWLVPSLAQDPGPQLWHCPDQPQQLWQPESPEKPAGGLSTKCPQTS